MFRDQPHPCYPENRIEDGCYPENRSPDGCYPQAPGRPSPLGRWLTKALRDAQPRTRDGRRRPRR